MSMSDLVELAWGESDGRISDATYACVMSDPQFPLAARALASKMVTIAAADRTLDAIFKDAGRYLVAMLAIYLHATGGLTLPRLKEVCASSGYLSPGRGRALLLFLRYLRCIEVVPGERRGTPARYVPTAGFTAAWQRHLCAALEAGRVLTPAVAPVVDHLGAPKVFDAFIRHHCEGLLASAQAAGQDWTFVRVFMHPYAGTQMVWALILAGDDAEFPPSGSIPISMAATARRFGVSRIHIRRLLDRGAGEGLLRYTNDGAVVLEEGARSAIRFVYATQLIQLMAAAGATLAELPELLGAPGTLSSARLVGGVDLAAVADEIKNVQFRSA